ncbi:patatin-like phospholipase family protein [Thalassiella azotivora]
MSAAPGRARRWGLVLGGGGVLGGAWAVGALTALEEVHGLDARRADVLVGTSAGSLLAALLGAGATVEELRSHQLGQRAASGPLAALEWDYETATGGDVPARPRLGPGSTAMVAANARRLRDLPPTAVLAALAPVGRGSLDAVGRLVRDVQAATGRDPASWSAHPGLRVVAMDYDAGQRVAFGGPGAPAVALADAVMASCSIPGWYQPLELAGTRYVDGGAWSSTNVDLLLGEGLDEVFVLAPMVSFAPDEPSGLPARMERAWRARVTRRCLREVQRLHATGTEVTVLGPGREDLEAIGPNLMAVGRRELVLATALETAREALGDPAHVGDVLRRTPARRRGRRGRRGREDDHAGAVDAG